MTEKKWTPGPWSLSQKWGELVGRNGTRITASKTTFSMLCAGHTEESRANGRLMNCAADMAEALEMVEMALDRCMSDDNKSLVDEFDDATEAAVRGALAKARGET